MADDNPFRDFALRDIIGIGLAYKRMARLGTAVNIALIEILLDPSEDTVLEQIAEHSASSPDFANQLRTASEQMFLEYVERLAHETSLYTLQAEVRSVRDMIRRHTSA